MDYFDEEEQKQKEALEEKKYQELYAKQAKISKRVLLFTFLFIGIMFAIIGIALLASIEPLDAEMIVFIVIGVVFIVLGIIFYFIIPSKGNYERYKKSLNRYGGINNYNIVIRIGLLEERIKVLE